MAQWVERNAQRMPDRPAYIVGEEVRTWREVDARTSRLGERLGSLGLEPGDRVAFLGDCGFESVETWFACLKAGLIFAGVNPRLTPAEMQRQIDSSAPAVVIHSAEYEGPLLEALKASAASPTRIAYGDGHAGDKDLEELVRSGRLDQRPAAHEYDERADCALFYTSGSAGAPKGVLFSNDQLVEMLSLAMLYWGLRPSDVWLSNQATANISVLLTTWNALPGIPSVMLSKFDPARQLQLIERHRVTAFANVVTKLERLIHHEALGDFDLSSIRITSYGSMPPSANLASRVRDALNCDLAQLYGMTEAGFFTCLTPEDHRRALEEPSARHLLQSCGRPFPSVDVEIVGEDGVTPCPPGTEGEIRVRGRTVSRGYWHLPEETAERFRDGWLYTGDVGRLDEDGYLYVTGRKKLEIVSGGFNVLPLEVERALEQHPLVRKACAVGVPSEAWGEEVQAVVTLHPDGVSSNGVEHNGIIEELHALCRDTLANFKRPKKIRIVDELPVSAAFKVDIAAVRSLLSDEST